MNILRGRNLATGEAFEFDVAGPVPFPARMTVDEAASAYKVSAVTIRRWFKSKKLPGFKIGSEIYFDPAQLREHERVLQGIKN